jgi:hypothetical protein
MAAQTAVNDQITDAATQANVKVLAESPAQALAMTYQTMAQAIGLSMQNAVANQQNMNTISTSVTTQGVNLIYSIPVAVAALGTNTMLTGNTMASLIADLAATVLAFKRG